MSNNSNNYNYSSKNDELGRPGPFLAKIVGHLDTTYMGILQVEILRPSGNLTVESEIHQVSYMSPFYGVTSSNHTAGEPGRTEDDTYNNTQKSYGMWMIPPDVGSLVVVIFIDGDTRRGYWIGCVQDEGANFMLPGLASTQKVVEDADPDAKNQYGRVPVAEYNKKIQSTDNPDASQALKPRHPFTDVLSHQGLLFDDIRGITSSSARREVPSMVFGISTPGPVDKKPGAKTGRIGSEEKKVDNAFVSRLGGTTFVMDDGDDRFLRKTNASKGPPEYASVENKETTGDVNIPHNELVRIRTRTGHQILFHNSEDLIYITNARGTSWVELTSDGKIDIYAEDSISIRTQNDLNFYADRDINIECGRNFNTKVRGEQHTHVIKDQILVVDGNQKIQVKEAVDITYETTYTHHVKQDVNKLYDTNYLQHVLGNVDKKFDGSLKTKIGEAEDRSIGNAVTISSGSGYTITAGSAFQVKASGTNIDGGQIHFNSGNFGGSSAADADSASEAELPQRLKLHKLSIETGEYDDTKLPPTIMRRVITTEPYVYHENVDPLKVKIDQTDRDIDGRYEDTDGEQLNDQSDFSETMLPTPTLWKTYSTGPDDTFTVRPPTATEQEQEESGT
jgi:hypothetical protein